MCHDFPSAAASVTGSESAHVSGAGAHSHKSFIVAVAEGRGTASEVGIAAIDLRTSECILSQFGDTPTCAKTLHRLGTLDPLQIIVSATTIEPTQSKLFQLVDAAMPSNEIIAVERKYFNDVTGLAVIRQLGLHEHEETLIPGLSQKCFCLSAAAALLKYIESVQNIVFTNHSLRFKYVSAEGVMMIDPITARNLELVQNLGGRHSRDTLFGALNGTKTSMGGLVSHPRTIFEIQQALSGFLDVDHLISSLVQIHRKHTVRHAEQAVNTVIVLKHILLQIGSVAAAIENAEPVLLRAVHAVLSDQGFQTLLETIDAVINEDVTFQKTAIGLRNQRCFAVRSGFNGLLDVARQTYKEATADVHELVEHYAEQYRLPIKLAFSPTVGFQMKISLDFLPRGQQLPAEFINRVDRGKQAVFTSLKLMSQNDRIRESLTEVYLMGDKIVSDLTSKLRESLAVLYRLSESIALLDMITGFAHVAEQSRAVRPEFTTALAIKNGRHPILESMSDASLAVVPNDVFSDATARLQIITGSNMSGKTTYLRQIALISVMAQTGSFVFADYVSVRLLDRLVLFSRIGTDDSLEANSSSFMCEMRESAFIVDNATDRSLVVIDELGRGTSTCDGLGVSFAICEHLLRRTHAHTFLVTHFGDLAAAFADVPGVVVLHMQATLLAAASPFSFSFKVKPGPNTVECYGIHAAGLAGLAQDVIARATEVSAALRQHRAALQDQNAAERAAHDAQRARVRLAYRLFQALWAGALGDAEMRRFLGDLRDDQTVAAFDAPPDLPDVDWDGASEQALLVSKKIEAVQLDALAVLKLVKHCRDNHPSTSTGQLLGVDVAGTLEITNCFPFVSGSTATDEAAAAAEEGDDMDGADYQLHMLRCLRALNFDAQTVGWYQSTLMGSFWNQALIETQYNYQKAFANAVVVVYDLAKSTQGGLSLRALRLSDTFMSVFETSKFSMENILKHRLTPATMFESVPIKIHSSHLLSAALAEISAQTAYPASVPAALSFPPSLFPARVPVSAAPLAPNFDTLELSSESYLEKHLEYLTETIDEHGQEQWRIQGWQRSFQKEQQKAQQAVALMSAENAASIAAGTGPVHTEDELKAVPPSLAKVIASEPSLLETLVITNQIDTYCKQINQFAGPTLSKMFIARGLQASAN
ncbi:MutS protein msh4 [Polyrhizophydium stewartii]|uniref:Eukaryotic translation initiation factor 3 subunit H n=1 Tax=Polyrhizophydium stewartii TaxID=2732419 RepID=A0ABR4NCF2_9FUNG